LGFIGRIGNLALLKAHSYPYAEAEGGDAEVPCHRQVNLFSRSAALQGLDRGAGAGFSSSRSRSSAWQLQESAFSLTVQSGYAIIL
jgi:hypothetical protein